MPLIRPMIKIPQANNAPVLPQEDDTYDLQKELEAKFDELFGSLDDEED